MSTDNPYEPSSVTDLTSEESDKRPSEDPGSVMTDTIIGVNTRWKDNLFQAVFIGASVVVAAVVSGVWFYLNPEIGAPWYGGLIIGGFCGLVLGLFTSGIALGVYRGFSHIKRR